MGRAVHRLLLPMLKALSSSCLTTWAARSAVHGARQTSRTLISKLCYPVTDPVKIVAFNDGEG